MDTLSVWARLAGLAAALTVAACGTSAGGLSVQQRFQTGQVCLDVAGSVTSAAQVGLKLANGSLSQPEAATQLAPVEKHIADLAAQNASLPLAATLKELTDSIAKVRSANPASAADVQAAGSQVTTATKNLLSGCAAVRH